VQRPADQDPAVPDISAAWSGPAPAATPARPGHGLSAVQGPVRVRQLRARVQLAVAEVLLQRGVVGRVHIGVSAQVLCEQGEGGDAAESGVYNAE